MRRDRIPGVVIPRTGHELISARMGKNRRKPGEYICICGATFTGINLYEYHRASQRREEMAS